MRLLMAIAVLVLTPSTHSAGLFQNALTGECLDFGAPASASETDIANRDEPRSEGGNTTGSTHESTASVPQAHGVQTNADKAGGPFGQAAATSIYVSDCGLLTKRADKSEAIHIAYPYSKSASLDLARNRLGVVMTKNTGYDRQMWATRREFGDILVWIKARRNEGYDITTIRHIAGVWTAVASESRDITQQYISVANYIGTPAREAQEDGLVLSAAATDGSRTLLVFSRIRGASVTANSGRLSFDYLTPSAGNWILAVVNTTSGQFYSIGGLPGWSDQKAVTRSTFPRAFIENWWNRGYDITYLHWYALNWQVVMSRGTNFTRQRYFDLDPDKISKSWEQGYRITEIY